MAKRFRPISRLDNAGTTGLLSNPNGTVVPSTASSGAQGGYGWGLPTKSPQVSYNMTQTAGDNPPPNPFPSNPNNNVSSYTTVSPPAPSMWQNFVNVMNGGQPYQSNYSTNTGGFRDYAHFNPASIPSTTFPKGMIGTGGIYDSGQGELQSNVNYMSGSMQPYQQGISRGVPTGRGGGRGRSGGGGGTLPPVRVTNDGTVAPQNLTQQIYQGTSDWLQTVINGNPNPYPNPYNRQSQATGMSFPSRKSVSFPSRKSGGLSPDERGTTSPTPANFGFSPNATLENIMFRINRGDQFDMSQDQFDAINNLVNGGNGNPMTSQLNYGQYVDNYGNVQSGTTPFGVNAQGQRLDAYGNVFDANDSKQATDIYGDRVVAEGTRKYVKGEGFMVAKDGRWKKERRLARNYNNRFKALQQSGQLDEYQAYLQNKNSGHVGSWGLVNFNTGMG